MIPIVIISLFFSLIWQGITSNILGFTSSNLSIFLTIYPLINLLILIPHFENSKKNILVVLIVGILVDIIYANTFLLNTSIFLIVYYITKLFHHFFPYNVYTINISSLIGIFLYHILNYIFLLIIRYDNYPLTMLGQILTHSIIMTIIYTTMLYLLIDWLKKKFELKEIR